MVTLLDLPNELLYHILDYLGPYDNARFQLTCHHFRRLATDRRIWRQHCAAFKYWSPYHNYHNNLKKRLSEVEWNLLYSLRQKRNRHAEFLLRTIVNKRKGRLMMLEKLTIMGEDAKEYLLDQIDQDYSAREDALARKFHADIALRSMHRAMAISRWTRYSPNRDVSRPQISREMLYANQTWKPSDLEDILSGFDLFAPTAKDRDINWSSQQLDKWANEFIQDIPNYLSMTTREKAVRLNQWLRAQSYCGTKCPGLSFYHLRGLFLGQVINSTDHMAIPLIQCTIYCAIAWRIQLKADCCPFPGKLHVIVQAPPGFTVDGIPRSSLQENDERATTQIFFDPYENDNEVHAQTLQAALQVLSFSEAEWLQPARPAAIATRHARNIVNASEQIYRMNSTQMANASRLADSSTYNNVLIAAYASMWATVLLLPSWMPGHDHTVSELKKTVLSAWPEDKWILHRFLPNSGRDNLHDMYHGPLSNDMPYTPRQLETQRNEIKYYDRNNYNPPPRYRVGQVFRHKKYNTICVITGWIPDARVASAPFSYYCFASENALPQIIHEQNVSIICDSSLVDRELLLKCGKYFRNFNPLTCEFTSNIRYEYPRD